VREVLDELRAILTEAYGRDAADAIAVEVARFGAGRAGGDAGWHRDAAMYVCYPDSFGGDGTPLANLTRRLDHVAALGCRALHVLPFFVSPRLDGGFDVADYERVDPRFGTDADVESLAARARALGIHLFADLVCNHVSDQHPWFRLATGAGDDAARYRDYFIHREVPPQLVAAELPLAGGRGRAAVYRGPDGAEYCQRVIFEGGPGVLPHWRAAGGAHYYHTFFEHQLDLDLRNPRVFAELAHVVARWGVLGFSFRLDAIPCVGRDVGRGDARVGTDGPGRLNHLIVAALRQVLRFVAPDSVLLVEAMAERDEVFRYLRGAEPGRDEADLAYEFHLTQAIWHALLTGDPRSVWRRLAELRDARLPRHAQFLVPLRTHDELLLEFAEDDLRLPVVKALGRAARWAAAPPEVRAQLQAAFDRPELVQKVPGRALDLLAGDERRLLLGHLLVASVPGCPIVYYGDELAARNDYAWLLQQTDAKRAIARRQGRPASAIHDLRDMQRAPLPAVLPRSALRAEVARLLRGRPPFVATEWPEPIAQLDAAIFAASWRGGELVALLNLGERPQQVAPERLPEVARRSRPIVAINGAEARDGAWCLPAYGGVWLRQPGVEA
jgi:glycosidase